jgi:protoheme IX farnesyltransferase
MYREDYGRAGILMLPVVEPDGRVTAQQIVVYTLMLLPVSLLPTVMGMSGRVYFVGAIVLGWFFSTAVYERHFRCHGNKRGACYWRQYSTCRCCFS